MGDLHQPLHTVSRVNKDYPDGDRGGNNFTLPKVNNIDNLHSVWDSIVLLETERIVLPFTAITWERFNERT
jgi:predicted transcriptional regulator